MVVGAALTELSVLLTDRILSTDPDIAKLDNLLLVIYKTRVADVRRSRVFRSLHARGVSLAAALVSKNEQKYTISDAPRAFPRGHRGHRL